MEFKSVGQKLKTVGLSRKNRYQLLFAGRRARNAEGGYTCLVEKKSSYSIDFE